MIGVLDPHHAVPAGKEKILKLLDIVLCPVIGHIVNHDLKYWMKFILQTPHGA